MAGCVNLRSTRTTTVLSCLSPTTTPCSVRFGIPDPRSSFRLRTRGALLRRDRLGPGNVAPHRAHPRRVFELARRFLEAQVEALLLQLEHLVVELIERHAPQILRFHLRL